MRPETLEGDDSYIKCYRLVTETLILAGGRHVLFSIATTEAVDQEKLLEKETKSEEEKFSAINLL